MQISLLIPLKWLEIRFQHIRNLHKQCYYEHMRTPFILPSFIVISALLVSCSGTPTPQADGNSSAASPQVTSAPAAAIPGWNVYVNEGNKYAISHPADWEFDESDETNVIMGPTDNPDGEVLMIRLHPESLGKVRAGMESVSGSCSTPEPKKLDHEAAIFYTCTNKDDSVIAYNYLIPRGKETFRLYYLYPTGSRRSYEERLKRVIESFAFVR